MCSVFQANIQLEWLKIKFHQYNTYWTVLIVLTNDVSLAVIIGGNLQWSLKEDI